MVTIQDGIMTVHALFGTTVTAPVWVAFVAPVVIITVFVWSALSRARSRR